MFFLLYTYEMQPKHLLSLSKQWNQIWEVLFCLGLKRKKELQIQKAWQEIIQII